jgi:hypothetical protein
MQPWQIKALELEVAALKHLDGIIADYGVYIFIGVANLLVLLIVWILSGGLRRKGGKCSPHVRPVIFIHLPRPPPPPTDTFDPFPPPRECACNHDHWED